MNAIKKDCLDDKLLVVVSNQKTFLDSYIRNLWYNIEMVYQNSIFYRPNNDVNDSYLIKLGLECPTQEQFFVIISNASNEQQSNIDQLSAQISSSKDVETLLDHVNWRMFI